MNIYVLMDDLIHPTYIGWYIALWDISGMIYIQRFCNLFANKNGGLSANLRGIYITGIVCGYGTNTMIFDFVRRWGTPPKWQFALGKSSFSSSHFLGMGIPMFPPEGVWLLFFQQPKKNLQLWCADSRVLIQKSHIHFSRPLPKFFWGLSWVVPAGSGLKTHDMFGECNPLVSSTIVAPIVWAWSISCY